MDLLNNSQLHKPILYRINNSSSTLFRRLLQQRSAQRDRGKKNGKKKENNRTVKVEGMQAELMWDSAERRKCIETWHRQNREVTAGGVFMQTAVAGIKLAHKVIQRTFNGYLEGMGPSVNGLQGEEKSLSLVTSWNKRNKEMFDIETLI